MTIDENSLRALRTLTNAEIALLSDGGDVEAFEVRINRDVWTANMDAILEYRDSRPNVKCIYRELDEIVVFFFTDPYVAFEFKMHCG
ncbi:MAG: hypothetical protein EOO77_45500 [Oxalobacteraceae bacterium]|nr:MAG: hypothetical protein EOO77_45500 [Oxalobacteraceae bacterium]